MENDDDDYAEFVAEMWRSAASIPVAIVMQRKNYAGDLVDSRLQGLVPRRDGGFYVNTLEAGERKTYVGERHKWLREGRPVDSSAFRAITSGVAPDLALRFVPRPSTFEAALSPENNHMASSRALVIGYRDADGDVSYRAVSSVRRADDRFTAHCHFRWGELRHFHYARLVSVADMRGTPIPIERFADRGVPLFPGR